MSHFVRRELSRVLRSRRAQDTAPTSEQTGLSEELTVFDARGEILKWKLDSEAESNSIILAEGVLKNILLEKSSEGVFVLAERSYMPDLVEGMLALSQSRMANSQILLMNYQLC